MTSGDRERNICHGVTEHTENDAREKPQHVTETHLCVKPASPKDLPLFFGVTTQNVHFPVGSRFAQRDPARIASVNLRALRVSVAGFAVVI